MALLSLSKIHLSNEVVDSSYYQAIGNSIKAGNQWIFLIYITFFALGAILLYRLLYQSKLVPRFISVWGFAAGVFMLAGTIGGLFDLFSISQIMLYCGAPIGINEFVLVGWLIVKGFNS